LNNSISHPTSGTRFDPAALQRRDVFEGTGVALLSVGGAAIIGGIVVGSIGAHNQRK
jgi:hypothetical protein